MNSEVFQELFPQSLPTKLIFGVPALIRILKETNKLTNKNKINSWDSCELFE